MDERKRTESIEDFLKAVYMLQKSVPRVRTNQLAEALGITAPSAHDLIQRCREANLVDYISHQGVRLTDDGERIALEVLRHHRLLELYLVEALGYSWDEVHEEADKLEHHISERLEARIAAALGNPTIDPHGDPIPALDGTVPDLALSRLQDIPLGQTVIVSRLLDQSTENLRYLESKNVRLGSHITIIKREPYDRLTHLEIDGDTQIIGETAAQSLMVKALT